MQLGDVLDSVTLDVATSAIEVNHVEIDSRQCVPGTLFFAMPGETSHGVKFVDDAARHGAVAAVSSEPLGAVIPVVVVPQSQLHALLAHASSTIVGRPEEDLELVGVTGTNGKTSVTSLVASLARALGWNGASIGTLTNERTTPASPELFRSLAKLAAGFDERRPHSVVALEVSSHALSQHRVEGLRFTVTAFTNLGHDHLDYHRTMEEYFEVKSQLFTREHAKRAVIWCDDSYGLRLADMTSLPVTKVRRSDATDVTESLRDDFLLAWSPRQHSASWRLQRRQRADGHGDPALARRGRGGRFEVHGRRAGRAGSLRARELGGSHRHC